MTPRPMPKLTPPSLQARGLAIAHTAGRGLGLLRTFAVLWLLGKAGTLAFAHYQTALEWINWLVPLGLWGGQQLAERFTAPARAGGYVQNFYHFLLRRFTLTAGLVAGLTLLTAPWLGTLVLGAERQNLTDPTLLFVLIGLTVAVLGLYHLLCGTLLGLGHTRAVMWAEWTSNGTFLLGSIIAALTGRAEALLLAYLLAAAGVVVGLALHLEKVLPKDQAVLPARGELNVFGHWLLARVLVLMSMGPLLLWAGGRLAHQAQVDYLAAAIAAAYRMAQVPSYVAMVVLAVFYVNAANFAGRQQRNRALVTWLYIGRWLVWMLALVAVAVTCATPLIARCVPWYIRLDLAVQLPAACGALGAWLLTLWLAQGFELRGQPLRGVVILAIAPLGLLGLMMGYTPRYDIEVMQALWLT
ncbi:MAG: hypothetical protein WCJ97_06755, partial [Phycisphaerae bacterium]